MPEFRGLSGLKTLLREASSQKRSLSIRGCPEGMLPLAMELTRTNWPGGSEPPVTVILFETFKEVRQKAPSFREGNHRKVLCLPDIPLWGQDRYVNHSHLKNQRMECLSWLALTKEPCLLLTTIDALGRWCLPKKTLTSLALHLIKGGELDQEGFLDSLEVLGYCPGKKPQEPGLFEVRGGIVDIFPPDCQKPVRVEFFGDFTESIRFFDPENQRSTSEVERIVIPPAHEALWMNQETRLRWTQKLHEELLSQDIPDWERQGMTEALRAGVRFSGFDLFAPWLSKAQDCLFSYLPENTLILCPDTLERLLSGFSEHLASLAGSWYEDQRAGKPGRPPADHYLSQDITRKKLQGFRIAEFSPDSRAVDALFYQGKNFIPPFSPKPEEALDIWVQLWKHLVDQGGKVIFCCKTPHEPEQIRLLLAGRELPAHSGGVLSEALSGLFTLNRKGSAFEILVGPIPLPFLDEESLILFLPGNLFARAPRTANTSQARKLHNLLGSFQNLRSGDLVVHNQHGIGEYLGMKTLDAGGVSGDFVRVGYQGGDSVYLPVDRLSSLQKFHTGGESSKKPPLDRLGGSGFASRKSKASSGVKDIAEELLKTDARRRTTRGKKYLWDSELYHEFEKDFPYEETGDQISVIREIEEGLKNTSPMDLVVVGDVGFGKTEVAMRATMRAVLSGYQVLVLVPTTILCYQHAQTFRQRLEKFGLCVEVLNRFIKGSRQKEILSALSSGSLDVLIGTHRLLSKDLKPKNLSLIIVDEEHRFGVSQKEKLKELAKGADLLTLTATPIPRTLHMAMIGLRNIAIMTEPPPNRLPVKTMLASPEDQVIREAIIREVGRGGQVFCLFNRVEKIGQMVKRIQELVPGIRVDHAHGQMEPDRMEQILIDFIEQRFPVLVCTTIIESGIDMPNVNTILIFEAQKFGLAQLYQLRGRVGRSGTQAFAWLLTGDRRDVSPDAKKRLDMLTSHQEPGSGFAIAGTDLEMRGAGNLLGGQQSGHAHAIGYEMYSRLLGEAIKRMRGEVVREVTEPELTLKVEARLPETYIKDTQDRLSAYRKIFTAENTDEVSDIFRNIRDRFGPLPGPAEALSQVATLKIVLRNLGIKKITEKTPENYEISFSALSAEALLALTDWVEKSPKSQVHLGPDFRLFLKNPSLLALIQTLNTLLLTQKNPQTSP